MDRASAKNGEMKDVRRLRKTKFIRNSSANISWKMPTWKPNKDMKGNSRIYLRL
jgi:hypothetical protein